MPDFKCPAWIGPDYDWSCDKPAEYAISGTILCKYHASAVQEDGNPWKRWFDDLQPTRDRVTNEITTG